jgi:carboxypeptidase Taq
MSKPEQLWIQFEKHFHTLNQIRGITEIIGWDQRTQMPDGAAEQRGEQLSYLEETYHRLITEPAFSATLGELEAQASALSPVQRGAVRLFRRKVRERDRIPAELAKASVEAHSRGYAIWIQARAQNDFSLFQPELEKILELRKQTADCLKEGKQTRYEAMTQLFEPEWPLENTARILGSLRDRLVPLLPKIMEQQKKVPLQDRGLPLSAEKQAKLNLWIAERIGFDFKMGRLDISPHPFCGGSGADVRLTTRYNEKDWSQSFYGVMHETGHGLYEQGMELLAPHRALRETPSMGLHESQSRFWENQIGRHPEFCVWLVKQMQEMKLLDSAWSGPRLARYVNRVEPSYIRVEADEVTYQLHILLRFELEQALFDGSVAVRDLPGAWNELLKKYLGLAAPAVSQGVLQDVHWSDGSFGYFPSYALGNLISAQIAEKIERDIPIAESVRKGEFLPLRDWLRSHVHQQGASQSMAEIVKQVSGAELGVGAFIRYVEAKFLCR